MRNEDIEDTGTTQHSYEGIDKAQHGELISDFMTYVQTHDLSQIDFSGVRVQNVVNFDDKNTVNGPVSTVQKVVNNKPSKPSLSKNIEYPGLSNVEYRGWTQSHIVGDYDQITKMIEAGEVDITLPDLFGVTALHKIASWGNIQLLSYLLPLLTETDFNRLSLKEGYSALHWYVESNEE
jgi:ankyrin repeat protein